MKKLLRLLILSTFPLTVLAQQGPNVPVIIVDDGKSITTQTAPEIGRPAPGGAFANFPEIAVTRIGQNTTGQHMDQQLAPTALIAPQPAAAPGSITPASPIPPGSPTAKLWPRDTVRIFMPSCVGFYPQFIAPCTCVINQMIATIPHDEFLRESDAGTIESDPRVSKIRVDCASTPKKQE